MGFKEYLEKKKRDAQIAKQKKYEYELAKARAERKMAADKLEKYSKKNKKETQLSKIKEDTARIKRATRRKKYAKVAKVADKAVNVTKKIGAGTAKAVSSTHNYAKKTRIGRDKNYSIMGDMGFNSNPRSSQSMLPSFSASKSSGSIFGSGSDLGIFPKKSAPKKRKKRRKSKKGKKKGKSITIVYN